MTATQVTYVGYVDFWIPTNELGQLGRIKACMIISNARSRYALVFHWSFLKNDPFHSSRCRAFQSLFPIPTPKLTSRGTSGPELSQVESRDSRCICNIYCGMYIPTPHLYLNWNLAMAQREALCVGTWFIPRHVDSQAIVYNPFKLTYPEALNLHWQHQWGPFASAHRIWVWVLKT